MSETDAEPIARMRQTFETNDLLLAEILEEPGEREERFFQEEEIDRFYENEFVREI